MIRLLGLLSGDNQPICRLLTSSGKLNNHLCLPTQAFGFLQLRNVSDGDLEQDGALLPTLQSQVIESLRLIRGKVEHRGLQRGVNDNSSSLTLKFRIELQRTEWGRDPASLGQKTNQAFRVLRTSDSHCTINRNVSFNGRCDRAAHEFEDF